jgi:hypothetical protein
MKLKIFIILLNILAGLTVLTGILFRVLYWPGADGWFLATLLMVGSAYAVRMIRKEPALQLAHNKGQLNLGGRVMIMMAVLMLLLRLPYSLLVLLAGLILLAIAYFLNGPDDPTESLHSRIDELGQNQP